MNRYLKLFNLGLVVIFFGCRAAASFEFSYPCVQLEDSLAKDCYFIDGFPVAETEERPLLFEGEATETMGYADSDLVPSYFKERLQSEVTKALSSSSFKIQVAFRFIGFDSFQSHFKESRGVIFLLHGGPGNYGDYMKGRVKTLSSQGFDVVMIDQRGGHDHRPQTLVERRFQAGHTLPLRESSLDVDPLVVADLVNFEMLAADTYAVIREVMSQARNKEKKFFIVGHSAGGEILAHVLALIGRENLPSHLIPTGVGTSGSFSPDQDFKNSWFLGSYIQHKKYMSHPQHHRTKLESEWKAFFAEIDGSGAEIADFDQIEILKAFYFSQVGWDISEAENNLLEILESVKSLRSDFSELAKTEANPVGAQIVEFEKGNKYTFNKTYATLVPTSIGGGLTDQQIYLDVIEQFRRLGIEINQDQGRYELNFIKGWPSYLSSSVFVKERIDFFESLEPGHWHDSLESDHRKSYFENLNQLAESGLLGFITPTSEDVFFGIKKVRNVVAFNGADDPVASPLLTLNGWRQFFKKHGLDILTMNANSESPKFNMISDKTGHGGLFVEGSLQLEAFMVALEKGQL